MHRNSKGQHSPEYWSRGINPLADGDEVELRIGCSVLSDRWRRGMALYGQLLDLPWWAWRRDREIVKQLGILREEYRGQLVRDLGEPLVRRAVIYTYPVRN